MKTRDIVRRGALWGLAVLTGALFAYLNWQGEDLRNEISPRGIVSLELRGDDRELAEQIVRRWRCNDALEDFEALGARAACAAQDDAGVSDEARKQVRVDFAFLLAYGIFFFWAVLWLCRGLRSLSGVEQVKSPTLRRFSRWVVRLAPLFAGTFLLAAALDALENVNLLQYLATLRPEDGTTAQFAAAWKFRMLKFGFVFLVVALLVRLRFAHERRQILQLLFLARVPILSSALLVALPVVCYSMETMLRNLLVVKWWQLALLTTLSGWLSGTILFTLRNVLLYGSERFALRGETVEDLSDHLRGWFWAYAVGLAAPLTLAAFWCSGPSWLGVLGILLGIAAVLVGYAFVAWRSAQPGREQTVEELLLGGWFAKGFVDESPAANARGTDRADDRERGPHWAEKFQKKVALPHADLTGDTARSAPLVAADGYRDASGRLRIGHYQNTCFFAVSFVIYVLSFFILHPALGNPELMPTLGYVLGLVIVLTWVLAGAAFYLDRYRVPLLFVLIAFPTLTNVLAESDHYFEVVERKQGADVLASFAARVPPSASEEPDGSASEQELSPEAGARPGAPIVVVAASGGGIKAAVWTAAVLTHLEAQVQGFRDSVQLLSTVSGGSAGVLHYVEALRRGTGDEDWASDVVTRAGATSLNAAAWGLAYPDLLRGVLPMLVLEDTPQFLKDKWRFLLPDREVDRGWALEYDWRETMSGSGQPPDGALLSDWSDDVLEGRIPPVIFNTTEVETGTHFVFSPLQVCGWERYGTVGHFRSMKGKDVRAATAARLSATFPWVTPISRPVPFKGAGSHAHFADGGFYDNFGVVSALHWIDTLLMGGELPRPLPERAPESRRRIRAQEIQELEECRSAGLRFDADRTVDLAGRPIVLVLIRASKADRIQAKPPLRDGEGERGWSYATVGPIQTLAKVRTSTQKARNLKELDLLECALLRNPNCEPRSGTPGDVPSVITVAEFELERKAPLSWKLTDDEWCRIVGGLQDDRNLESVRTLQGIFRSPTVSGELSLKRDGRECSAEQLETES